MESEHGSKPISDLRTNPATTVDKSDLSTPGKKLGFSSPSSFSFASDTSSEDPFRDDEDEPRKSTTSTTGLPILIEDAQLASNYSEKDLPGSSSPNYEQSNHDLPVSTLPSAVPDYSPESSPNIRPATQSPPVQVMERPGDPASYRIPSSVFTRTKSTTPMEWSVASNESLFSIHTGNMSFTGDQMLFVGKSGELVKPGEPVTSSSLMNFSSNPPPPPPPVYMATDIGREMANLDQGFGVAEVAAETMREVLRENEEERSKEKLSLDEQATHSPNISRHSNESGASVKSFAFPILTEEVDNKGRSLKVSSQKHQQHRPPKPQPEPQTPTANPVAKIRLFSCFSCCLFCR
ncbi:hypothetical protein L1049_028530 [Liquidambar formosana]|uniref:Uncharacterized protein n=1 Tax=Liquidambar formosana TaxID=63359 RepID=A0AAP0WWP7_LIQFO